VSLGARLVLLELLNEDRPLTGRELRTRTLLPGGSVRQAVSELVAADLVTEYPPETDRDSRQYGMKLDPRR
jgi:DNA-binding MarR family transcriptional regulator